MKIKVSHLPKSTTIVIKGDETWLQEVYCQFKGDGAIPPLVGVLTIVPTLSESVAIQGELNFSPEIGCGRCSRNILWDLSCKFSVLYRPLTSLPREKDLIAAELDIYFIEDDEIDIAELVAEQIELMVPASAIRRDPGGSNCLECGLDVTSTLVGCTKGASQSQSPFAKLKTLED